MSLLSAAFAVSDGWKSLLDAGQTPFVVGRLWCGRDGDPRTSRAALGVPAAGDPHVQDGAGELTAASWAGGDMGYNVGFSCSDHLSLPTLNFFFPNASLSVFLPVKRYKWRIQPEGKSF